MACACKVNQNISYLQKKYGMIPKNKETHISMSFTDIAKNLLVILIVTVAMPIMFFYTIFKKEKNINITKLFRLSK